MLDWNLFVWFFFWFYLSLGVFDSESGDLKEYKEHADNFMEINYHPPPRRDSNTLTPSSSFFIRFGFKNVYYVFDAILHRVWINQTWLFSWSFMLIVNRSKCLDLYQDLYVEHINQEDLKRDWKIENYLTSWNLILGWSFWLIVAKCLNEHSNCYHFFVWNLWVLNHGYIAGLGLSTY